jgi:transcriptional regulator with XRE-family HTH domain
VVGERQHHVRERIRHLSQDELAKAMGVHFTAVSKWENAQVEMGLATAIRLCDVLDIAPNYLLGKEDIAATRALRSGPSFFVNHEAVKAMRAVSKRAEISKLVHLEIEIGVELPATWTPVEEAAYRALQREAQTLVDRFGRLGVKWADA